MLGKNQVSVLNLFRKDIFLKASIKNIADRLKKSYPRVYEAVKKFEKEGVLNIERVGRSDIVSIDLNEKAVSFLSFLDEQEMFKKDVPHLQKILSIKEISNHIIIIAGSYASGKATKKSDLDMVIISDDKYPVALHKLIENKTLIWQPSIHLYTFKQKDFIEMLISEEENYGKEIFKNHIILKGASRYYELVREAIKHGFRN